MLKSGGVARGEGIQLMVAEGSIRARQSAVPVT